MGKLLCIVIGLVLILVLVLLLQGHIPYVRAPYQNGDVLPNGMMVTNLRWGREGGDPAPYWHYDLVPVE